MKTLSHFLLVSLALGGCAWTEFDDLRSGAILFDIQLEDRVEHLIRGQALVVALVGSQLRRRRLDDDNTTSRKHKKTAPKRRLNDS